MPDFGPESTIREVLEGCHSGRDLLLAHGYDVGDGFMDVLSQYQSLRSAAQGGRLRDLDRLIRSLKETCSA